MRLLNDVNNTLQGVTEKVENTLYVNNPLTCGFICIDTRVKVCCKQKLNIATLLILNTFFVISFMTCLKQTF